MVTQSRRQTELDILRLLATLAVITMHAGDTPSMFVAGIVWCVPVFFMISGRFFLDPAREIDLGRILRKYLPQILAAYVVWTAVYVVYYVASGAYAGLNLFGILNQYIEGPYHFWYLFALAGLYLLTPLLRRITADEGATAYFLILFAAYNLTTEYLIYLPKLGEIIRSFSDKLGVQLGGYVGYFVLGWYIHRMKDRVGPRLERLLYGAGILLFALTVLLEGMISPELQAADFVKQYRKTNVVLYSACLYLFFVKRVARVPFSDRTRRLFARLTEYGFGVYCAHALVNELLPTLPLGMFTPVVRVAGIYLVSLGLTALIRRIPVVGKRIT